MHSTPACRNYHSNEAALTRVVVIGSAAIRSFASTAANSTPFAMYQRSKMLSFNA
jgi:hypothetical protein